MSIMYCISLVGKKRNGFIFLVELRGGGGGLVGGCSQILGWRGGGDGILQSLFSVP
ncbi:conserved hypothetical protein [Ricinus communis]|uniref:Uncharacterized protein n=1 Tax=Ricinus communis TaxID=3988 RepID=B9SMF2_RICCO|nr:conserved hypothetical protein [Ricinus communis]